MKRLLTLTVILTLGTGCGSVKGPHQSYLVPAIEGRVVDADTGEPVVGARVQKLVGLQATKTTAFETKGAQQLMKPAAVKVNSNGQFNFKPEKGGYLLFNQPGVYSFKLVVRQKDYQTLSTNIDLLEVKPIKTENGPLVNVGNLPLQLTHQAESAKSKE